VELRSSPPLPPPRSRDADQLLFHKFTDAKVRKFAAIAGFLHSTEWLLRRGSGRSIDEDHERLGNRFVKDEAFCGDTTLSCVVHAPQMPLAVGPRKEAAEAFEPALEEPKAANQPARVR
jgi:hypothetical protein